jgi:hypothetical protein
MTRRLTLLAACALALALGVFAPQAVAKDGDGDGEARVSGTCSRGASSELRLRAREGRIAVEFTVKPRASRGSWRTVIVHERRVEWRGTYRARGSFRVRRSVRDLVGPDQITTRATGPGGATCTASATLAG